MDRLWSPRAQRFCENLAVTMLSIDQGHDTLCEEEWILEAAWYRETADRWGLWLALDLPQIRILTPRDTFFTCPAGASHELAEHTLALRLVDEYQSMHQACL